MKLKVQNFPQDFFLKVPTYFIENMEQALHRDIDLSNEG